MNKMKFLIASCILLTAIIIMQVVKREPGLISFATADTTDTNPNGSSELSKLMREMQAYTSRSKENIIAGKLAEQFPDSFNKIYSARITEGMVKSDFYDQFADLYIASVKNYASSSAGERIATHNNMVSACLACHSQHCPGPVPAIKKLIISDK
jgi:hypothetical protein